MPGQYDAEEDYIRARLAAAARALRALPARGCFPAEFRTLWPDMLPEFIDQPRGTGRTRLPATPEDIAALDEVTPWLYALQDRRWRLAVFVRALHPSAGWRRLGSFLGVSHETARAWERQGIAAIRVSRRRK